MTRHEFSLARRSYIDKADFTEKVIKPQLKSEGPFLGIALARVGSLRALRNDVNSSEQAVCVTDTVTELDFDTHAALGYSESHQALTAKRKAIVRATLHANLADTFGDFMSIDQTFA